MRHRTPQRDALDAAERDALDALRLCVTGCEWCFRNVATEPHHVCQGANKAATVGDVRLLLLLCRDCHDELHRLTAANRAIALALLYCAGRLDLELFYERTNRRYPDASTVMLWVKRLTGAK